MRERANRPGPGHPDFAVGPEVSKMDQREALEHGRAEIGRSTHLLK